MKTDVSGNPEFEAFPKIPRLRRGIVITEKIDGTNAAIGISEEGRVYAQSRKRIITPDEDNFGFARWVAENAESLHEILGPGLHFGEWWGSGIQRGYGLTKGEKRFSLFNVSRWGDNCDVEDYPGLAVVPLLYTGPYSDPAVDDVLATLHAQGSVASPGFDKPEGIIVYHSAARQMFKVLLENDDVPKSLVA